VNAPFCPQKEGKKEKKEKGQAGEKNYSKIQTNNRKFPNPHYNRTKSNG